MTVLTASAPVTEFARTTEVHRSDDGPGEFTVELDGGWSSLVGIHGGYMCAVAVRAAEAFVPGRGVRTTTTSFVRRGRVGPATISVREIRRGRSISTVAADLVQDGELVQRSDETN
jgi:acyl-CoA thioesterase